MTQVSFQPNHNLIAGVAVLVGADVTALQEAAVDPEVYRKLNAFRDHLNELAEIKRHNGRGSVQRVGPR